MVRGAEVSENRLSLWKKKEKENVNKDSASSQQPGFVTHSQLQSNLYPETFSTQSLYVGDWSSVAADCVQSIEMLFFSFF